MKEILFAGFGGQGVLTAGKVLMEVAAENGFEVTWTSSYGAEMRGGTASCQVVVSEEEIGTPYSEKYDFILAFNNPSYQKFKDSLREDGKLIVNSSLVDLSKINDDSKIYSVEGNEIIFELDYHRGINVIMLGALAKASSIFPYEDFLKGVEDYFKRKGYYNEKVTKAFNLGYEKTKLL